MSTPGDAFGAGVTAATATGGVLEGVGTAGSVATFVGMAGGTSAAVDIASAAATVGAAAAAAEAAVPIPVIGAIVAGLVAAGTAIGEALSAAERDGFKPTQQEAEELLVFFRLDPALAFSGVDNAGEPNRVATLIRYLRLVSGEIKPGQYGNNGVWDRNSCANPYICQVDPTEPLTDPKVLEPIYWQLVANLRKGQSYAAPSMIKTPAQAQATLTFMRKYGQTSMNWSQLAGAKPQIREEVKALRLLAGEDGPDPALATVLGGDVTVHQPPKGPGPYKPGVQVYVGGLWYVTTPTGFVGKPMAQQPPPPAPGDIADQLDAAKIGGGIHPIWWLGGFVVLGGIGLLVVRHMHKSDAIKALPPAGTFASGADTTFRRVLEEGVHDEELAPFRTSTVEDPRLATARQAFADAWARRINATKLASSGRYLGTDAQPIRIEVYASGKMQLSEGRHYYDAAREAGAKAILANVVQYNGGRPVVSQTAPVKLL